MGKEADRATIRLIAARLDTVAGVAQSNFAFFCLVHGALGEAFERLRQAFLLHARAGADFEQAINLGKLSWAQEQVGRPSDALDLALESAEWLRRLASDPRYSGSSALARAEGKSLWRAACAAAAQGENEAAISFAEESLRVAESIDDGDTAGRARTVFSRAAAGAGRLDEALTEIDAAIAAFPADTNPWHLALALQTKGRILEAAGRDAEAEASHRAALRILDRRDIRDGIATAESHHEIARIEERRGEFDRALLTRRLGLRAAETVIDGRGLRAADRSSLRQRFRAAFESGAALAFRLGSADDALRFMEGARPAALGHLADRPGFEPERLDISVDGVAALLDADAAWVEYLFGESASFAIVVSADGGVSMHELGHSRAEIARRADALSRALRTGDAAAVVRAGREAGEALLDPISDAIANRSSLLFSLDDAALVDSAWAPAALVTADGRFLVESAAIALEPSARIALDRALVARSAQDDGAFEWIGSGSFVDLLGDRQGRAVVSGAAATRAAFRGGLLSGHARLRVASRMDGLSTLEMAAGESVDARDVALLPSLGGAIVVLDLLSPATATSPLLGAGLPHAFLTAGARAVLAPSLLEPRRGADDRLLLRDFDRAVASGTGAAEALRRAQLHRLSSRGAGSANDPCAWAFWVLLGGE
jgi:tetratricopeptide (TPR) repeat protein